MSLIHLHPCLQWFSTVILRALQDVGSLWMVLLKPRTGPQKYSTHRTNLILGASTWNVLPLYLTKCFFKHVDGVLTMDFFLYFLVESFIYIASDSLDTEGTLLTRNITGTSHSQCLAFNYHITGTSSNIKVFWESKPDDVIGWTANPKMNTLSCAAFSISTLETDKVNMPVLRTMSA